MATFTALASGQTLTGTENQDTFVLSATTAISVFGLAQADLTIVKGAPNIERSYIELNGGPDTLDARFSRITGSTVRMGAGGDTVLVSGTFGSDIRLGDGSDTYINTDRLQGTSAPTRLAAGAGADYVFVEDTIGTAEVLMGAGADTLEVGGDIESATIEMGGGADVVIVSGEIYIKTTIALGAGSDTLFAQNAPIFNDGTQVQGGGNSDLMLASSLANSAIIRGGAGGDTIEVGFLNGATIFGDAGSDSIFVSSVGGMVCDDKEYPYENGIEAINQVPSQYECCEHEGGSFLGGTIKGGSGTDTIEVGSAGTSLAVFGGAGKDLIDWKDGEANLKFENPAESNINSFDTLRVQQSSVNDVPSAQFSFSATLAPGTLKVASGQAVAGSFSTNEEGFVVFDPSVPNTLEARVTALSAGLGVSNAVVFQAEGGQFLFVAGANKSSIEDDYLVKVEGYAFAALSAGSQTLKLQDFQA